MKYTNIKRILKTHIDKNIKSLWTHDKSNNNFTNIYRNYTGELNIYTPHQLLNYIKQIESNQDAETTKG